MLKRISNFWVGIIVAMLLANGGALVKNGAIASDLIFSATGPANLTVAGEGVYVQINFAAGETPWLAPYDEDGNPFPDGNFKYELVIQPIIDTEALQEAVALGDDRTVEEISRMEREQMKIQTGSFEIIEGSIVMHEPEAMTE